MLVLVHLIACSCNGGSESDAHTDGVDTEVVETDTEVDPPPVEEVTLATRDGVNLVADVYPAWETGRPALVLLHMVPPTYDRTTWPVEFVERLQARNWTVLVLDRRGAGESEGLATEAYTGEKGRYDVEAAVAHLVGREVGDVAILGASNGTTSMIDYAVWAPTELLREPVGLGFMTGGGYTENQTAMEAVPRVPAVFTFSTVERAWSVEQQESSPSTWVFHEYAEGDHGTKMFTAAPAVADDLVAFYAGLFGETP